MNKIKKLWEDKTGVSPIIAVILMVAITVVLAATIYVWVSGFGGGGGGTSVSLSLDQTGHTATTVTYDINSVNGDPGYDQLNVTVAGNYATVSVGGTTTPSQAIRAGDSMTLTATSVSPGDRVVIKYEPTDTVIYSADVSYA